MLRRTRQEAFAHALEELVAFALDPVRRGTAEQVAATLDMTVSGARQHLSALVEAGLAEAAESPEPTGKRGRRTLVYAVTPTGDALFPKAYGELTNELLGFLDDEEPETVTDADADPSGGAGVRTEPTPDEGGAPRWDDFGPAGQLDL